MFIKKRNFTIQERKLLLEILKSYKEVVNNKKTDAASAALKKRTWMKIAQKYNSSELISESARPEQLRRLWQNMKTRQRENVTRECSCRLARACQDMYVVPDAEITRNLMVEIECTQDSDDNEPIHEVLLKKEPLNIEEPIPNTQPQHRQSSDSELLRRQSSDSQPLRRQSSDSQRPFRQSSDTQSSNTEAQTQNAQQDENKYANVPIEDKIRISILQKEYIERKRRADELHRLEVKKKELELEILKIQLLEAQTKAQI